MPPRRPDLPGRGRAHPGSPPASVPDTGPAAPAAARAADRTRGIGRRRCPARPPRRGAAHPADGARRVTLAAAIGGTVGLVGGFALGTAHGAGDPGDHGRRLHAHQPDHPVPRSVGSVRSRRGRRSVHPRRLDRRHRRPALVRSVGAHVVLRAGADAAGQPPMIAGSEPPVRKTTPMARLAMALTSATPA